MDGTAVQMATKPRLTLTLVLTGPADHNTSAYRCAIIPPMVQPAVKSRPILRRFVTVAQRIFAVFLLVSFLLDLVLAVRFSKERWFLQTPWPDFLGHLVDLVYTWAGKALLVVAIAGASLRALLTDKPLRIPSMRTATHRTFAVLRGGLRRLSISVPTSALFVAIFFWFVPAWLVPAWLVHANLFSYPDGRAIASYNGAAVVASPDARELYVADAAGGVVRVTDLRTLALATDTIHIGSPGSRASPERIATSPDGRRIFVTNAIGNSVEVIDRDTRTVVKTIGVGLAPRWISLTPDGRKAYVANEQPIPSGSISVIDTGTDQIVATIGGVNCPESLAITPDGKHVYVVTQCGAGRDPVFVIDTHTDKVVATLPGFAVGLAVAITPNGRKVYVTRGRFNGLRMAIQSSVNVLETATNEVSQRIPLENAIEAVFTADSRYALVANGNPLASTPGGLAVVGASLFCWLPEENRMFTLRLDPLTSAR